MTGNCENDCQTVCAYPGQFSECAIGAAVPDLMAQTLIDHGIVTDDQVTSADSAAAHALTRRLQEGRP